MSAARARSRPGGAGGVRARRPIRPVSPGPCDRSGHRAWDARTSHTTQRGAGVPGRPVRSSPVPRHGFRPCSGVAPFRRIDPDPAGPVSARVAARPFVARTAGQHGTASAPRQPRGDTGADAA